MFILYIALGAAAIVAPGFFIARKMILRNMKLKNLALVIHEGKLQVDNSALSKAIDTSMLIGEVVGAVEDDQLVFIAFSCPVTGRLERVKFWIGDAFFRETMKTDKPDKQSYLGLTIALDELLRKKGKTAILPEVRA